MKKTDTIRSLVSLYENEVDAVRLLINETETAKDNLHKTLIETRLELERQRLIALECSELISSYEYYCCTNKNKQKQLSEQILVIESKLTDYNARLFSAYSELKKYELIAEKYDKINKKITEDRENKELDDIINSNNRNNA